MTETLRFSEQKQYGFIGHIFLNKRFYDKALSFVHPDWFINPLASKIYNAIIKFNKTYNRQPSPDEIKDSDFFENDERELREKIPKTIDECIEYTKTIGLDILQNEIDDWFSFIQFKKTIKESVHEFNNKQIDKAWSILDTGCVKRISGSFQEGSSPVFAPAVDRALIEKHERLEQSKRILNYGVGFLDDALGGIIPNDLIFLGARSNAGKTALANSIARFNAAKDYPVHFFALEAEQGEMERRTKFSILADLYYKYVSPEDQGPVGCVNYLDWRLGRLESLLAPFEKEAIDILKKESKNFYTLYRTSGDFGLDSLDRHLTAIGKDSSLIVIDHIHYVDIEGENENRAYKDITKKIRDSCLKNGVPVIVIAHLRKEQNSKQAPLVPRMEDFHGSSDLFKIATAAIMLAPAFEEVKSQPWLWPTYIRAVKSRLEQARTRYTGIVDFNIKNNLYENRYRIGRLVSAETEWQELEGSEVPFWAKGRI